VTATAARGVSSDLAVHLRRARDHVDRHFAEHLDLDRLARVAGVSKYHFVRSFEAARGAAHVPGCFLFMRGVVDLGGTTGPR
jgi:AraC-like DNA-binding protein